MFFAATAKNPIVLSYLALRKAVGVRRSARAGKVSGTD